MMESPHAGTGDLAVGIGGRIDPHSADPTLLAPPSDRARSRFVAATRFVEENLDREIALSELASVVSLSVSHFAHAFKAQYGISPHRYLIERRIDRAKTLLRTTDDTIACIAQRVGFSSQAHFGEHFAKITGVTPSAYRRAGSLGQRDAIASRTVNEDYAAVLESSARLRSFVKRLWLTSTVDEALAIAAEEAMQHFDEASLVFFVHRVAPGRWRLPLVLDRGIGSDNARMFEDLAASLTPAAFDEIGLYPALSNPGDIGMRDTLRLTSVAAAYEAALARHHLQRSTFIHARIRSRDGITAGITVKHASERAYSELERASISAIASLTSLALS